MFRYESPPAAMSLQRTLGLTSASFPYEHKVIIKIEGCISDIMTEMQFPKVSKDDYTLFKPTNCRT
jgi:hypothetical protein